MQKKFFCVSLTIENLSFFFCLGIRIKTKIVKHNQKKNKNVWVDALITKVHPQSDTYDIRVLDPNKYNLNPLAVHVTAFVLFFRVFSVLTPTSGFFFFSLKNNFLEEKKLRQETDKKTLSVHRK